MAASFCRSDTGTWDVLGGRIGLSDGWLAIAPLMRPSRCFNRFCKLTAGFLGAAWGRNVQEEARSRLTHCSHGDSRLHFNFARRQWVQLRWIRVRLCEGLIGVSFSATDGATASGTSANIVGRVSCKPITTGKGEREEGENYDAAHEDTLSFFGKSREASLLQV